MQLLPVIQILLHDLQQTTPPEYIAVITGIASVLFSRKENILVYPVGLVSTIIYIYISVKGNLIGEASVNLYYTIMSIYGWILWAKVDKQKHETLLHITYSNKKELIQQLLFFAISYVILFYSLTWAKQVFAPGAIPWADAFASATAYTGMWLMAKKKIENWLWWIATNIASIPLYYIKGYAFTSVQFIVLLVLAVMGWITWSEKIKKRNA